MVTDDRQRDATTMGRGTRPAGLVVLVLVLLTGALGVIPAASAALVDGTLDTAFTNSYAGTSTGFDDYVNAVALQPDGKIIVGGAFTEYNNGAGANNKANQLARVNADGTLDTAFSAAYGGSLRGLTGGEVLSVAVQTDGKIVVGGSFTGYNTGSGSNPKVNKLARFNADGTLDTAFSAAYAGNDTGLNDFVNSVAVQADGKIVAGGGFTSYNNSPGPANTRANRLTRFNSDGSLDIAFSDSYAGTLTGLDNSLVAVALQADGKILVGGLFSNYNNGSGANNKVSKLARFNADGALDTTFTNTYAGTGTGLSGTVTALAVQGDGKVVVGGQFVSLNDGSGANTKVNKLARFTAGGVLDTAFTTSYAGTATGLSNSVHSVAVQGDGRIVVGGAFTSYNNGSGANTKVSKLARFTADGGLDTGFTNAYAGSGPGLGDDVASLAEQPNGKILVGGFFHDYNDGSGLNPKVNQLARFNGTLNQTITFPSLSDTALNATAPVPAATASSGLPVTYTSDTPAACTIAGGTITLVTTGTCSITANQAGNDTFQPASPVARSFTVTPTPTPGPTPSPTPEPTPRPTPTPRTTLTVKGKPKAAKLKVGRSTTVVKRVTSNGSKSVKAHCTAGGKKAKRVCDIRIQQKRGRVVVAPRCSDKVAVTVKVTAEKPGAQRTTWTRSWKVAKKPFISCSAKRTG